MARPRKDAQTPRVTERIKDAFWELYRTRPLEQIYVKEVCARASCNKTTFYYHFDSMACVLEEIERECMLVDLPNVLVNMSLGRGDEISLAALVRKNARRINMIRTLLGPQGDPKFRTFMECTMLDAWCSAMNIDQNQLDDADKMFLRYLLGGSMNVVASRGNVGGDGAGESGAGVGRASDSSANVADISSDGDAAQPEIDEPLDLESLYTLVVDFIMPHMEKMIEKYVAKDNEHTSLHPLHFRR